MRILWIPHTGWALPQRAHPFCRELAKRHEVHVTDWVADFTSPADYFSRRYLRNFVYRQSRDGQIMVHGIPRMSPALFFPALRRLNAALFSRYLRRIIATNRIDVVVGTFVAPPPRAPRLVFDIFDDNVGLWHAHGRVASYAREIEETEQAYLQIADAVVTASSVLTDRVCDRGYRGPLVLIPNGLQLRDFARADGDSVRAALGIDGPIIGLVGNHDRWDELAKVLEVARLLSHVPATFLIVGRGAAVERGRKVVQGEGLTNVRFTGFIPPDRVADYFAAIDVGLCAYAKGMGEDARSPMRLLAYSAAGCAVVCTELLEVRRMHFPNVILVDDSARAMAKGVLDALRLPRQCPLMRGYRIEELARRYEHVLDGGGNRSFSELYMVEAGAGT